MNPMHIGLGLLVVGLLWTHKRAVLAPSGSGSTTPVRSDGGDWIQSENVPWDDDWGQTDAPASPTPPVTRADTRTQAQTPQRVPTPTPTPAPAPAPSNRTSTRTADLPDDQRRILATINAILSETVVNGVSIHPPVPTHAMTNAAFEAFRRICVLVLGSHTDWSCVGLFDGFPLSAAYRAPRPNIEWYRSYAQFQQFVTGERGTVPKIELSEWLQRLYAMPDHRNVRYQLESLRAMWSRVVNDAQYRNCKVDWRT